MKKILLALISGLCGGLLVSMTWQPSFASGRPAVSENLVESASCVAKIGTARMTPAYRCLRDEVMVGRWEDNIYCATLEIVCGDQLR